MHAKYRNINCDGACIIICVTHKNLVNVSFINDHICWKHCWIEKEIQDVTSFCIVAGRYNVTYEHDSCKSFLHWFLSWQFSFHFSCEFYVYIMVFVRLKLKKRFIALMRDIRILNNTWNTKRHHDAAKNHMKDCLG